MKPTPIECDLGACITFFRFHPHNEWFKVETHRKRWERWHDSLWSVLFAEGFLRKGLHEECTPALPLHGVKLVLSYHERGTASAKAWWWLARTEADDELEVAAIREYVA